MRASRVAGVSCAVILLVSSPALAQGGNTGRGGRPTIVDPGASIDIVVRPVRNGAADVQYAEIRATIKRSLGVTSDSFGVRGPNAPSMSAVLPGSPPVTPAPPGIEVAEMADGDGIVPVAFDSAGRQWRAQRKVTFPVTVTYKARMWPAGTRTNPSPMLRSSGGAVSAQGSGMFVTPTDGVIYNDARFRWDLSDLAPGSITVSGQTDDNDVRGTLAALSSMFYMAGPLHRYPAKGERDGFAAYWHGSPPWDGDSVMSWVASMYEYRRKFHRETFPRRYRVMGRMLPPPAFGGQAFSNHFIFNEPEGPRDSTKVGPILLLSHEIGHLFIRGLQNPGGGGPSNNWFTEGLNEYYAVMLALRSGLAPLDMVLAQMNLQTRNYFTNNRRNMPADSIAMFNPMTDGRAQNASYERGLLFWADMDARIRAASKGRHTLDSVMVPLIARARELGGEPAGTGPDAREGGQPGWFTPAELVDSLVTFAGPDARVLFDSVIMRGATLIPASNAFGPCFELRPTKISNRYASGSGTSAAGLPPVPEIDAYLWYRVPSVPDSRCRNW